MSFSIYRTNRVIILASIGLLLSSTAFAQTVPQELTDALAGKVQRHHCHGVWGLRRCRRGQIQRERQGVRGRDWHRYPVRELEAVRGDRSQRASMPATRRTSSTSRSQDLMANFAKAGKLVEPRRPILGRTICRASTCKSWIDMGTKPGADGKPILAGVWERVNVKSLVWYPKEGVRRSRLQGSRHLGRDWWPYRTRSSPTATRRGASASSLAPRPAGPPPTGSKRSCCAPPRSRITTSGPSGELKFDSPQVKKAAESVGAIWLDDKYVFGGTKAIVSTSFGDAPAPMFDDPPKCWLHKQGNFITTFFPQGPRADSRASTTTSSTCPASTRPTASRRSSPATSGRLSTTGRKCAP